MIPVGEEFTYQMRAGVGELWGADAGAQMVGDEIDLSWPNGPDGEPVDGRGVITAAEVKQHGKLLVVTVRRTK